MPSLQQQVTSTDSYNYLLFLPDVLRQDISLLDPARSLLLRRSTCQGNETQQPLLPTILFLHGAGERGCDLDDVKKQGVAKIVEQQPDFPFIVISPQCPRDEYWNVERLSGLLDEAMFGDKPFSTRGCANGFGGSQDARRLATAALTTGTAKTATPSPQSGYASYPIDPDRLYLTGLSMGGYGVWHLAAAQPQRFAAIAPICGGGNPLVTRKLKNLPVWAFHGAKDNVVPLSASEIMVSALKARGGNVKFTVYPEADHDSWTQTYNNYELYEWFLQHRRQQAVG
ncbi:prolyl oligopeptidase family serine peptidase [Nostoc sp.]|uniref:carboxylesterase family protein n=1 Tax=Nostoc sp. TaxID=1180 RepID=UPI002FF76B49